MVNAKKKTTKKVTTKVKEQVVKQQTFIQRNKLKLQRNSDRTDTCRELVTYNVRNILGRYKFVTYVLIKGTYIKSLKRLLYPFLKIAQTYMKNNDIVYINNKGLWIHRTIATRQYVSLLTGLIRIFKTYTDATKKIKPVDIKSFQKVIHKNAPVWSIPMFIYSYTHYAQHKYMNVGEVTAKKIAVLDIGKMMSNKDFQKDLLTSFRIGCNGIVSFLNIKRNYFKDIFTDIDSPKPKKATPIAKHSIRYTFYTGK